MNIAILGAGAMGMLFGSLLAQKHHVCLIDTNPSRVEQILADGVQIHEQDGTVHRFRPSAAASSEGMKPADLVIVFVKAMYSRSALKENLRLIGPDTFVMTLQNGAGHGDIIKEFVPGSRIIIGTTQHNSSVISGTSVHHGGGGKTCIGSLEGTPPELQTIAKALSSCGIETSVSDNIQKIIWNKLFLNASASVLTGILQVPLGFLADDPHGWSLTETLVREAVSVARGEGLDFDADCVLNDIRCTLEHSRDGLTSIYADLKAGRLSEVDTISGFVVKSSARNHVPAPSHAFVLELIHAMENCCCHKHI